jgi:hypothetical protein
MGVQTQNGDTSVSPFLFARGGAWRRPLPGRFMQVMP